VFDHVTIRVADRGASLRFYDTVLGAIGIERTHASDEFVEWDDFGLAAATGERPPTTGLHVAFVAASRDAVDAFWRAGVEAGYPDDGAPGPRPQYSADYYGAFLRDPDGNSAEAVHHGSPRAGVVDHLWIRVADLDAATRFYELVGTHAGFRLHARATDPARTQFAGRGGSFSVVADAPSTRNLHLAFPAANEAVDSFHAALTAAGHRDNGAPGERPVYHPGYYGAFVLDPDGNNVEVVGHNRASA
jgi:catechol 2,3-dioxygenase-like lactoylglutathione lyase family enzyme